MDGEEPDRGDEECESDEAVSSRDIVRRDEVDSEFWPEDVSDVITEEGSRPLPMYRWRLLDVQGTKPTPRYGGGAVYDPVHDRLLYFGGTAAGPLSNELWELTLEGRPKWRLIEQVGDVPRKRTMFLPLRWASTNMMVIFGGGWYSPSWQINSNLNDVWVLPLNDLNPQWSQLLANDESGRPYPRKNAAGAIDEKTGSLVIFGGYAYGRGTQSDTWETGLDAATAGWALMEEKGEVPAPRSTPCSGYYTALDGLFIGGGGAPNPTSMLLKDAWFLPFSGEEAYQWRQVRMDPNRPWPYATCGCVYDPVEAALLCYGVGEDVPWDLYAHQSLAVWLARLRSPVEGFWELTYVGGEVPDAQDVFSVVYDSKRDRFLHVFGFRADDVGYSYSNSVWVPERVKKRNGNP